MKLNHLLQYANNPVAFAREALNFHPDSVQIQLLQAATPRGILCCTRQWGKSTTTAVKAVHQAWFQDEALILIAARTARQSAELVRKCATFLSAIGVKRRGDGQNAISLLLPNRSRIIGLPGDEDNIRGFSAPSLILIDEASRVPDALYHALLPMLATSVGGQLWMMSTPNGKQGFFHDEWMNTSNEFTRISVTAHDCPRIAKVFLNAEAARIPRSVFEQEYLCAFNAREDALISECDLSGALDHSVRPLK